MTDLDNLDRELLTETERDDELLDSELDTVTVAASRPRRSGNREAHRYGDDSVDVTRHGGLRLDGLSITQSSAASATGFRRAVGNNVQITTIGFDLAKQVFHGIDATSE
jgi:hypothetical protein